MLIKILFIIILFIPKGHAMKDFVGTPDGAISANGVKEFKKALSLGMAPRGSASMTSSGKLSETGIKSIVHIAPGSMSSSDPDVAPTLEGIKDGLRNGLIITKKKGRKCAAIPFIGSGIFLQRLGISKDKLAAEIAKTVAQNSGGVKSVLVAYSQEDFDLFKAVLSKNKLKLDVVKGSITDFNAHKCDVIFNAANTELVFGGGLSGHIGGKTQKVNEINKENKQLIEKLKSNLK